MVKLSENLSESGSNIKKMKDCKPAIYRGCPFWLPHLLRLPSGKLNKSSKQAIITA